MSSPSSARVSQILAAVMDDHSDVTLPNRLCAACARAMRVDGAAISLITSIGPQGTVAATDEVAAKMMEQQVTLGEGPCLDAVFHGQPVLQPELSRTGPARWPVFTGEAIGFGLASLFAFPIQVGGIQLGVLATYRRTVHDLDFPELEEALDFAEAATVILLHMQEEVWSWVEPSPRLPKPIMDHAAVHQATGMVSVQAAVGLAEALLLLRGHAFSTGRSLLDIAKAVVERQMRFGTDSDPRAVKE